MADCWLSIQAPTEGFYKVKGSKFYAYAYPVETPEEAEGHLELLRKKHWDSRHVAFAWRFGRNGEKARAYDAGEPAHSAGDPILNELRSRKLTEILVVVVRYFGGTKLGISGLIDAYKSGAAEALDQATVETKVATQTLAIRFPYSLTSEVNRIFHQHQLVAVKSDYGADCYQEIAVRETLFPKIKAIFEELAILDE